MTVPSRQRAQWIARWILPHEAELRAWLTRRAPTGLDVDDVVQEAYAVLAGLAEVDHIRNPRTYLFEVAKSVVLQALRRSRIVPFGALSEAESLEIPCEAPGPEAIVAGRQELEHVARLIAALPPKCREVFVLRKVHELSQRQVAEHLGISENTVEKHMGKALRFVTNAIAYGGNFCPASSTGRDSEFSQVETRGNRLGN